MRGPLSEEAAFRGSLPDNYGVFRNVWVNIQLLPLCWTEISIKHLLLWLEDQKLKITPKGLFFLFENWALRGISTQIYFIFKNFWDLPQYLYLNLLWWLFLGCLGCFQPILKDKSVCSPETIGHHQVQPRSTPQLLTFSIFVVISVQPYRNCPHTLDPQESISQIWLLLRFWTLFSSYLSTGVAWYREGLLVRS